MPDAGIDFLGTYCLDCHEGEGAEAELDLARFQSLEAIVAELSEWDKIRRRVREGDMPPDGYAERIARLRTAQPIPRFVTCVTTRIPLMMRGACLESRSTPLTLVYNREASSPRIVRLPKFT